MNLRKLDLNLLTIFDAIITEGSLTSAANGIGMSQPAMSNALSRLRYALGDDLFVRDGRSIRPTSRALELAPQVREALAMLANALDGPTRFDPTVHHRFGIGGFDYFEAVLLPQLRQRIADASPTSGIVSRTGTSAEFLKSLRYGDLDVLIDYVPLELPDVMVEPLYEERLVILAREGHPIHQQTLNMRQFAAQRFVWREDRSDEQAPEIDVLLSSHGFKREMVVSVTNWVAMPNLVFQSDLIATMPMYLAQCLGQHLPLKIVPLPFEVKPVPIYMMWHATRDQTPANRWLRAQIKRCSRELTPPVEVALA